MALTVLLALGIAGGLALHRASNLDSTVIEVDTPALVSAVRLETALTDQETGVRGYGLTGQESFLDPYHTGVDDQRTYTARLRTLVAGDRAAGADLDEVTRQATAWQQLIALPVVAAPPGGPVALAVERADEGKRAFDKVRAATTGLQQTLAQHRDRSRAQLRDAGRIRDRTLLLIAAVILGLTAAVFAGLRRGVTRPLDHLSSDVRKVAGGSFEHEVIPTGPADLRLLAADIELMRGRMVRELAFSDEVRQQLDERATDLRRSNEELEQFAYVASHDLQEPLRKVASFCQLLQRRYADQLDERAGQYIGYAVDGANRMQTLIQDLLSFSRVGRLHAETSPVDLEELFTRTADALSIAIEESGTELSHDRLPTVTGDPTQLGVLLQNLLSNAVKFRSPDRPARVAFTAARHDDGMWHFAVADNGIGIDKEFAEQVFVIFQRLHTRETYPGNGIGLALCKKVVEFHGGTIAVDTGYAPGTRITFTLPGSADGQDPAAPEESQE
jgi:signal transduction histidine kinase